MLVMSFELLLVICILMYGESSLALDLESLIMCNPGDTLALKNMYSLSWLSVRRGSYLSVKGIH